MLRKSWYLQQSPFCNTFLKSCAFTVKSLSQDRIYIHTFTYMKTKLKMFFLYRIIATYTTYCCDFSTHAKTELQNYLLCWPAIPISPMMTIGTMHLCMLNTACSSTSICVIQCPQAAGQQLKSRTSVARLLLHMEPGEGQRRNAECITETVLFAWTSLWSAIWLLTDVIPTRWLRWSNPSSEVSTLSISTQMKENLSTTVSKEIMSQNIMW